MPPQDSLPDTNPSPSTDKPTSSSKAAKPSNAPAPIHLLVLRQDSESVALLESALGSLSYSDLKKKKRKSLKCAADAPDGKTALHYAALCGNLAGIKMLLAHGWDPAQPDAAGYTPLDVACYFGHPGSVRALLAAHDFSGGLLRPLKIAARMGNLTCLSCIVENYPGCSEQIKACRSLVHYAAAGDSELCVRYLADFGCPVDGALAQPVPEIDLDNNFEAAEVLESCKKDEVKNRKEEDQGKEKRCCEGEKMEGENDKGDGKSIADKDESDDVTSTEKEAAKESEDETNEDGTNKDGISIFETAAMNGSLRALEELVGYIDLPNLDEREREALLGMLPKALIAAAMHDYADILALLLNLQHELEQRDQLTLVADSDGSTLLHYTCANKSFYSADMLLQAGYSAFAKNACGVTPAELAAHYGNTAALSAMYAVDGERLCTFTGSGGRGLLHLSAESAQVGSVVFLLSIGCSANATDAHGRTALHYAVCNGSRSGLSCIKPIIVKGEEADEHFVDKRGADGRSALHLACAAGHTQAVLMLIQEQATTALQDDDGNTPIMLAAAHGFLSVVRVLYLLDSDFSHRNAKHQSILHLAAQHGMVATARFILDQCSVKAKKLTKRQQSGEKTGSADYTPVVELLGDPDAEGKIPLELAIDEQQLAMIRLLVCRGTDVSAAASDGTPFERTLGELLGEEELNALKEESAKARTAMLRLTAEYAAAHEQAVAKFNEKPAAGVEFLRANGWMSRDDDDEVVDFLTTTEGLDPNQVGEYIGKKENSGVLTAFVERQDFAGMEIDEALRAFFTTKTFFLSTDTQVWDRIIEAFSKHYYAQNEGRFSFRDADSCYVMAFSIIMLNTDAHNPRVLNKMTMEEFIKNSAPVFADNNIPEDFLRNVYTRITTNGIKAIQTDTQSKMAADWMTIKTPDIKSTKKRWGYFCKDVLAFYKRPPVQGAPLLSYKLEQFDSITQTEEHKLFCLKLSIVSDESTKGEVFFVIVFKDYLI